MKTISLRDANQQFSKLVRDVEESGEPVVITRNGKAAVKISAVAERAGTLTREQAQAKARLMDSAFDLALPKNWKFDRGEIYAEAAAPRRAPDPKKRRLG